MAVTVVAAGCSASPAPATSGASVGPGTTGAPPTSVAASAPLKIVAAEPTSGLDPATSFNAASTRVMELIYDGLLDLDAQDQLVAGLAKSWDTSSDGLTYTFHLQPNGKFSDGTPVTAADVVFSLNRMSKAPSMMTALAAMKSAAIVDPQTVSVTLSAPSRPFLNALATAGSAAILSEAAVKADPSFTKPTATSGAWKLTEWIPKDHISLVANSNYWNAGFPKIPTISYTFDEDPTSAAAALESGTAEMYYPMAPTDAIRLKGEGKITMNSATSTSGVLLWGMDKSKPPFSDVKVRQAVAYMVPRQDRMTTCWQGTGAVSYGGVIGQGLWAYSPGLDMYNQPQAQALQTAGALLDSAGWVMGSGGVRTSKGVAGLPDGTAFSVKVPFESNWDQARCNTTLLKNDLAPLGVEITPQAYDPATFYQDIAANKFEFWHAGDNFANVDNLMQFAFTTNGSENAIMCQVTNTQLNDLVNQAWATSDLAHATDLYLQAQKLLEQEVPCIPTGNQADIIATVPSITGYYARPDSSNRSLIYASVAP
jgi:peptide/nickel transport system substrate-binding protein